MKKITLFPGSFSPFTNGHLHILKKALKIFDIVYIGIGENSTKKNLMPVYEREKIIRNKTKKIKNIKIINYKGLTVEFCKKNKIKFIIRGLRDFKDFEFEKEIYHVNKALNNNIETMYFMSDQDKTKIKSSLKY
tara:strand:- start:10761 stop:11162 length:402 start_codon:yes stop_codon:yes gene_type:complete